MSMSTTDHDHAEAHHTKAATKVNAPVGPKAPALPVCEKLKGKRVVLACNTDGHGAGGIKSILELFDFHPEFVPEPKPESYLPSAWEEQGGEEWYSLTRAQVKAWIVFERLTKKANGVPPHLVIATDSMKVFPPVGALQHKLLEKDLGLAPREEEAKAKEDKEDKVKSVILATPKTKEEQLEMLQMVNGKTVQSFTAVSMVYPWKEPDHNGDMFRIRAISHSTLFKFFHNSEQELEAYIASGEGMNHPGGHEMTGMGRMLVDNVEGSWDGCVGFPSGPFWRWLTYWESKGEIDAAWA